MNRERLTRRLAKNPFLWVVVFGTSPALGQHENSGISSARILAKRALTRVADQIAEATGRGQNTTWASQPGAVAVFSASRQPRSLYKLYSAPQMVESSLQRLAFDVPFDWDAQPERYVDLNIPRTDGGELRFPIADPRTDAEGFSYEATVSGVVSGRSDEARLPMPVTWLYVLEDGNEGYLDRNNRFVGSVMPTVENPIIGRYGFWADDNSSKINVNTASEGVYWDTPRVNTIEDRSYGRFQPINGEYQRYPGHPARVSLSSVLFPHRRYHLPGTASNLEPLSLDETKAIWDVARGISTGGSTGGTRVIETDTNTSISPAPKVISSYGDEEQIAVALPADAAERVAQGQFFLTTESRSDDTNLFGYPRISMWPMSNDRSRRTVFDQAMAAVSTINNGRYFLQRQDAYARHWEFYTSSQGRNIHLFSYLQAMTDGHVPGYSSSFAEKYGTGRFDDRDQILAQSLGYLRGINLFDGTNRRWLYTNGGRRGARTVGHGQVTGFCLCGGAADHVERWYDGRLQEPKSAGRIIGLSEIAIMLVLRAETKLADGDGNVAFIGEQDDLEEFGLWDSAHGRPVPEKKLVQMGILFEGFAPAQGWTSLRPYNTVMVSGGTGSRGEALPESFTLGGWPLSTGRPAGREYPRAIQTSNRLPNEWIAWGGYGGVRLFEKIITFEPVVTDTRDTHIDFGGSSQHDPVRIVLYDSQAAVSLNLGNSIGNIGNQIQSYLLAFPPAELPVPDWWAGPVNNSTSDWYSFEKRMKSAISDGIEHLYSPTNDVIQSLVPRHGDYRLINSWRVVSADTFVPHPDYGKTRMAHSFVGSDGPLPGATFGRELIPGADYARAVVPDLPISPDSEEFQSSAEVLARGPIDPAITGDWDSGVGPAPDGAYNNMPDDGDTRGLEGDGTPYFDPLAEQSGATAANAIPHRMALPGLMGSLSTGMRADIPWQTLLFRPAAHGTHYGAKLLPDHLWLDLFRMPVVGPTQNSDAFSTDGKVNLNYRIVPFSYIHRSTALHSALKSEKVLAIPTNAGRIYKTQITDSPWRRHIDAAETLKQWEEKFERGELFRTASEICEHYLVPEGERWQGAEAMENFWQSHKLTGDNVRERPYANLHAMLTTKSNSFEVHIVAQTIRKSPDTEADLFDSKLDAVTGEWRGSGHIDRYLDPEDEQIVDYVRDFLRINPTKLKPQGLHRITGTLQPVSDAPFAITETKYDPATNQLTITWRSNPGEIYGIELSVDRELTEWENIDPPPGQSNNPFYRGIAARGYETSHTIYVSSQTTAVRVRRR